MEDLMEELQLTQVPQLFEACIAFWHAHEGDYRGAVTGLNPLALELARRNYELWHEEDQARRTDVDDGIIASVKRKIDVLNQSRNDMIEKLDEHIMAWLTGKGANNQEGDVNSETPGSIVDRISILSLKVYHMHEDTLRSDISSEHRERSRQRMTILQEQRADLYAALEILFSDYLAGRKRMKLYRQFKMYNDPDLNPELYGRGNGKGQA
jgi:hypothetical protein